MTELAFSAAAERNRGAILAVLRRALPASGRVLEIASGTGQHITYFARELPHLTWLPSEPQAAMRDVIQARIDRAGLHNVAPPQDLDVLGDWPDIVVAGVIVANLLHISPAATLPALCAGAARVCRSGGVLHIYGPFKQDGQHTAPSNAQFDASLRARDRAWGIRDLEEVIAAATASGFTLTEQHDMPANNFSLVFTRS